MQTKMFRVFSSTVHVSSINDVLQDHEIMDGDDGLCDSLSTSYNSTASIDSYLSEVAEDATSSTSYSPSSSSSSSSQVASKGPLYELSELMAQLPIKRGLSKYFQGKSQSFTSLSNVICIEDLAKTRTPYSKKMKAYKSIGGGLDCHKSYKPRACRRTISKKASRVSRSSLLSKRSSFLGGNPGISMHKNF
ncbi:uncharacterized protein LOC143845393 [Tasmannia lanceolata]|uniref:uncharacterized protein LOC143845393 n=1 Tax=Tasmannia lanceolata TaxID=3420 RepID=UPI004063DAE4